jgi:hypothetical protein
VVPELYGSAPSRKSNQLERVSHGRRRQGQQQGRRSCREGQRGLGKATGGRDTENRGTADQAKSSLKDASQKTKDAFKSRGSRVGIMTQSWPLGALTLQRTNNDGEPHDFECFQKECGLRWSGLP